MKILDKTFKMLRKAFVIQLVSNCMRKMLFVVAKTSNVGGVFLLAVMRI